MMTPNSQPPAAGPARFIGGVFGFAFAGIGLTVLIFLWTVSGFGSPPLFFRIFGSFIAIIFVAVGGTVFLTALKGPPLVSSSASSRPSGTPAQGAGYTCPGCGARLDKDADVSPKGDVKCGYCRKWFNIHG